MNLTNKKCRPCEGGTQPLASEDVEQYMKELPDGWQVRDGKKIKKEFLVFPMRYVFSTEQD